MGILFLYFFLTLKVVICVFDAILPTYFNLYSGNEASQSAFKQAGVEGMVLDSGASGEYSIFTFC